ncbi:single-stranded DNA-binding protein [Ruania alba]|uniref:Single-stranded DNA-binding protein n=1 Tax=Ruania alba TaxID=648782 RepID=A0A1H5DK09_9MICO|nr:single-stranded DNA-binding protein [Ruania alba]SED79162.1 single-strand DNA-binding protein [Ruania alba]
MANEVDVTVRGYVGHNPTLNQREGRQPFLRLNVASTPRIRDRDGEWSDGTTQWFSVKFFGDFAENVAGSVRKGDAVLVRGRLEHEEYLSRDGEPRWSAVIVAHAFGPDLHFAEANVRRVTRRSAADEDDGLAADGVDVSGLEEVPEDADGTQDLNSDDDHSEDGYLVEQIGA